MSVLQVAQRIANMYALIPGIKTAYWYVPRTMQPAQLPAIGIEVGQALYDTGSVGDHTVQTTTIYRATLFYDNAKFGTETQSETGLLPLIDNIRDYFLQRPGLQLDTDPSADVVFNARIIRSDGYQIMSYPAGGDKLADFAIVKFFHEVVELAQITNQY